MKRQIFAFLAVLLCALLSGCESFDPGSLITDTRVLGARVEVVGDEARASPRPGEQVDVRWVVVAPDEVPALSWAFVACLDLESCAQAPLAFQQGEGQAPALTIAVPARERLGNDSRLHVLGVICQGGSPALGEDAEPRCNGDTTKSTAVMLDIPIAAEDEPGNLNPSLDDARVALDGKTWRDSSADVASGACGDDDTIPHVTAGSHALSIAVELGPDVREHYALDGASLRETLQLSQFVSAGKLEGQFSFVDAADPSERPALSFDWTPPKASKLAENGTVVRLILVLRDLRGGLAVAERALCVVR